VNEAIGEYLEIEELLKRDFPVFVAHWSNQAE
jgi:hypothetical protein